jgi:hypothetical protein
MENCGQQIRENGYSISAQTYFANAFLAIFKPYTTLIMLLSLLSISLNIYSYSKTLLKGLLDVDCILKL